MTSIPPASPEHVPVTGSSSSPPTSPPAPHSPASVEPPVREKSRLHEVKFVSYPNLLFVWPLLLAGIIFWPLQAWVDPGVLGWIYIWVAVVVVMTLGVDIDRNQFAFWVVLVAAVWILGLWLKDVHGITVFGNIYRWFSSLHVQYSRGFGLAVSALLLLPYLFMLVWARLNDRWRITHNEFEHFSFGKTDDSLGRGAKTIRSSYPDVLELFLGLAGTLIVYNASGTRELRRIPHVVCLPFVRKRLDSILARTAITGLTGADEEEEEEDQT